METSVTPVFYSSRGSRSSQQGPTSTGGTWWMPGKVWIWRGTLLRVTCLRAGPGVKNFVRERRRESCRERSLAYRNNKGGQAPGPTGRFCYINLWHFEPFTKVYCLEEQLGPKVSDFIDLNFWTKKTVCCGTIFVNSFGEAILDPRFIKPCNNHHQNKRTTALTNLTFEQIVKKELDEVREAEEMFKTPDRKERQNSDCCDSKTSSASEPDEGFFDRSLSSPCSEGHISQNNTTPIEDLSKDHFF